MSVVVRKCTDRSTVMHRQPGTAITSALPPGTGINRHLIQAANALHWGRSEPKKAPLEDGSAGLSN